MGRPNVRSGIVGSGFAAAFHFEAIQRVFSVRVLLRGVYSPNHNNSAFFAKEPEIRYKVNKEWANPSEIASVVVTISVKVTRSGEVISTKMVRGSGDVIYDRSTEVAVLKASPLPIPDDPRCYEIIKEFEFDFLPEG